MTASGQAKCATLEIIKDECEHETERQIRIRAATGGAIQDTQELVYRCNASARVAERDREREI